MYWNGPTYSLLTLLRKLVYLHSKGGTGYVVNVITPENIHEYIPALPECFYRLQYAHQADYVRVQVLCERGGIWLDSDTIVMDSLDVLFDIMKTKEGFFIQQNNDGLWNGVFGTRPRTRIMQYWKRKIDARIQLRQEHLRWSEIGSFLLNTADKTRSFFRDYILFKGLDTMYPVNFDTCDREFLDRPYENYQTIVRSFQPIVVLVNTVYKRLAPYSEDEILAQRTPLHYFLETSFRNAKSHCPSHSHEEDEQPPVNSSAPDASPAQ